MQVVNYYKEKEMLVALDANDTIDNIFRSLVKQFKEQGI
jgi:hypothetical protein